MKIAITNSNRGLGKELSTRFDNVIEGFSDDCDVFINNRHNSFILGVEVSIQSYYWEDILIIYRRGICILHQRQH